MHLDVIHPKCIYTNENNKSCKSRPSFAKPGDKKPQYCSKHKPEGYIDITNDKCLKCKDKSTDPSLILENFSKIDNK